MTVAQAEPSVKTAGPPRGRRRHRVWTLVKVVVVVGVAASGAYWLRFAPVPVTAFTLKPGVVVAEVMGTGTLEARVSATVSPKISGRIMEVLVDEGDQVEAGQALFRLDDSELKRQVGMVELPVLLNGSPARAARFRAVELLEYLGVGARSSGYPPELSGGEQQRVAIARALANEPSVVLADEPTGALDGRRGRQVVELFRQVAHEHGAAVIVVTHDHRTLDVFDAIYEMEDGVIRPRGTVPPVGAAVSTHQGAE
jgi:ABC-type dipeptide/oligopeptide/nickel transport system ATPase component